MNYSKIIALLFSNLTISTLLGQVNIADTLNSSDSVTIAKIEYINIVYSSCISIDCRTPEQWFNYQDLKKSLNTQQLFELTNNKNATVRTYAYWALIENASPLLIQCLKKHRNDLDSIKYFSGCSPQTINLIDFWVVEAKHIELAKFTKDEKKEFKKLIKEIVEDRKSSSAYIKSHF